MISEKLEEERLFDRMKREKNKVFDYEKLLLFLLCIGFAYMFYGKTIAIENTNYGIEQLHQYDSDLFKNNIGLLEADFSPRYFANMTVSLFMHLFHISWAGVVTFIIRLNFIIYVAAVVKTINSLTKKRLLFGLILISCVFRSSLGTLASFGLNGAMDVFIGTGTALVLLAISFLVGEKKNWMATWILLALATLMHVHEGMWGGCIVGALWLSGAIAHKRINWKALKGLPIYVIVMLCVTVPNLLQGEAVDAELFTEIYVYIRTPHHLLPTDWGMEAIVKSLILLMIPTFVLIIRFWKNKKDEATKTMMIASILSVALWVGILILQYVVTVVKPNTTMITMYMPKCFKYVTYIAMLLYLKIADSLYCEKRYLQAACALLILVLGMDYSFVICAALAVVLLIESAFDFESKILEKEAPFYYDTIKLLSWQVIFVAICLMHGWHTTVIMIVAAIFVTEFVIPFARNKRVFYTAVCIFAVFIIGYSIEGKIFKFEDHNIAYVTGDECLRSAMGNDIYQLSLALKDASGAEQEFLADPYDIRIGWVQLMSERNCYAIAKCTPSSKKAVIDWYARIKQVENMVHMSDEELADLMEELDIQYVFISPDQYDTMDESELFEPIMQNKTAAIYKLN